MISCRLLKSKNDAFFKICHLGLKKTFYIMQFFQFPTFFENKKIYTMQLCWSRNGASLFFANQDMSSCKLQGGGLKITMVIMSFSRNHTYVEHYTWNLSYLSFKGRTGFAEKF